MIKCIKCNCIVSIIKRIKLIKQMRNNCSSIYKPLVKIECIECNRSVNLESSLASFEMGSNDKFCSVECFYTSLYRYNSKSTY